MCLYPKLILNKRYCPTKKNGGVVPPCPDNRLKYVTAAVTAMSAENKNKDNG